MAATINLDAIPITAIFLGTVVLVFLSIEAGYRLGMSAHRRSDDEKESPGAAISATVLGLVAFILAFTFGIVTSRFDVRKQLVRDEANAIGTAWLRADFLPEPDRAEAKSLLVEYVETRLAAAPVGLSGGDITAALLESDRIKNRLWDMAVVNARKDMNSDVAALYIESLNQVIDLHALRVAIAVQERIHIGIWAVLIGIMILGMMGVGYQTGIAGSKRSRARPILAVSFALVIALIASLDSPRGFIKVTQQPLMDARDSMTARSAGAPRTDGI